MLATRSGENPAGWSRECSARRTMATLSASAVSLNSNPRATGSITTVMPGARLDDARPPVHTETEVSNSTAVGAEYGVFAVTLVAITLILARWADRRSEP